jgi:hypothetical protein
MGLVRPRARGTGPLLRQLIQRQPSPPSLVARRGRACKRASCARIAAHRGTSRAADRVVPRHRRLLASCRCYPLARQHSACWAARARPAPRAARPPAIMRGGAPVLPPLPDLDARSRCATEGCWEGPTAQTRDQRALASVPACRLWPRCATLYSVLSTGTVLLRSHSAISKMFLVLGLPSSLQQQEGWQRREQFVRPQRANLTSWEGPADSEDDAG